MTTSVELQAVPLKTPEELAAEAEAMKQQLGQKLTAGQAQVERAAQSAGEASQRAMDEVKRGAEQAGDYLAAAGESTADNVAHFGRVVTNKLVNTVGQRVGGGVNVADEAPDIGRVDAKKFASGMGRQVGGRVGEAAGGAIGAAEGAAEGGKEGGVRGAIGGAKTGADQGSETGRDMGNAIGGTIVGSVGAEEVANASRQVWGKVGGTLDHLADEAIGVAKDAAEQAKDDVREVADEVIEGAERVRSTLAGGGRLGALDDVENAGARLASLHGTDVDAGDEVAGLLGDLYQRLGQAFTKFAADRSPDFTPDRQPAETETRTSTTTTALDDGTVVTITETEGPNGSSTVREERRPDGTVERKTNSDNGHGGTVNMTETRYPSGMTELSVQRTSGLNTYYSRGFTSYPDGSYEEVVREASPEHVRYYRKNVYFKDDGSVLVQPQVDIVMDAAGVHVHTFEDQLTRSDGSSGTNAKIDLEIANGRATMSVVGAQSISADGAKRESPVFEAEAGPNGVRVTYESEGAPAISAGYGETATASQGQDNPASQTQAESVSDDSKSPAKLHVWDGSVEVAGHIVNKGESLRAASDGQLISGSSGGTPVTNAPRPDLVQVDPNLFGDTTEIPPGLYVWVRDGTVSLKQDGQQVEVAAGNAVVVTKDQMTLLDYVPNFLRFDQTPPDGSGNGFTPPPFVLNDGSVAGSCAVK